MKKHYNYITIDLDKKTYNKIKVVQGNIKTRYIVATLISNNRYYDLSDCVVRVYGVKADDTKIFNNATILNAEQGEFEIELTNQALAIPGNLTLQVSISGTKKERLTSFSFVVEVFETIVDDSAIESSNEFGALIEALDKVDEWDRYFQETSGKIEQKYTDRLNKCETQIAQNKQAIDELKAQCGNGGGGSGGNDEDLAELAEQVKTNKQNIENLGTQVEANKQAIEQLKSQGGDGSSGGSGSGSSEGGDFVYLSKFGNNFESFKKAIEHCKTNNKNLKIDIDIDLQGVQPITIDFNLTIDGNYKSIKVDNDLFICTGKLFLDKLVVNQKESGYYEICWLKKGGQLICTNSKFLNFKHTQQPKECIIFDIHSGSKSYFYNIELDNIKSKGNGSTTDGIGSQRFVRTIENPEDEDIMGVTVIKNIIVSNFYNIDGSGNPVTEDSDPIVFQHGVKKYHNAVVENAKGKNIGKRFIKVQSPNVVIKGVYLNNEEYNGEVTVLSIQRGVNNVIVDGLEIQGNLIDTRALETFDCENIVINNVLLNIKSIGTKSGAAFNIGGKNIRLSNIRGNVGGFLTFINEEAQNVIVENVDVNVEFHFIYYDTFKNDLKANFEFNNVNVHYKNGNYQYQCILFRNGTNKIHDIYFNNCRLYLVNAYQYGVLALVACHNVHFNDCIINTSGRGYGVYLNESHQITLSNCTVDRITHNNATSYLLHSKIDYIESIQKNNKILISSLLKTPEIKHSDSPSSSIIRPYNV